MPIESKHVLLLKAQKSHQEVDKYEELLVKEGYVVRAIKTLEFNFINLDGLRRELERPDEYSGLILTSPRCVDAVKLSLGGDKLAESWWEKCNYVVGNTTYDFALKELGLVCMGRESGNAGNLSAIIKGGWFISNNFSVYFFFSLLKFYFLKFYFFKFNFCKFEIFRIF